MRPLALRRDGSREGVGVVAGTGGSTLGSGNGGIWSNCFGGIDVGGGDWGAGNVGKGEGGRTGGGNGDIGIEGCVEGTLGSAILGLGSC